MLDRLRRWLRLGGEDPQSRADRRRLANRARKAAKRRSRGVTAGLATAQGDWSTDDVGLGDVGSSASSGGWGGDGSGGGDGGGGGD